jgi:UDP-2,3-diacylglucosamine pyrophosphatase LpxH
MQKYRSVFISDLHLGTTGCQAGLLLNFLKTIECENLYLVGDVIDGWRLRKRWHFPQEHVNVVHNILKKAKCGTNVYWVSGNHDEFIRNFIKYEIRLGNVHIDNSFDYVGMNGKKYLVIHGDLFDGVTVYAGWISKLGDSAYTLLLKVNKFFNWFRRKSGRGYWSLSRYLKHQVKSAVNYIFSFEDHLSKYAKKKGYDGVICGHIHTPEIKTIDDIEYMNDGDFVESCSALVETYEGKFELIHWR